MSIENSPTSSVPAASVHGGDGPRVALALGLDPASILDLSQTLNPFAPDVSSMLARRLDSVRYYPDKLEATGLLADAIGVDRDRLLLTNGGSEAISLVAAEIGGRVRSEPEFALHPRHGSGPIWRSDPHSPSGRLAGAGEAADVWDEAFYQMATGKWTAGRSGVVVGSLTKLYACPGLRLGYLIADEIGRFTRHQPHWSVNSPALAVLPDLLAKADLAGWSRKLDVARCELEVVLADHGLTAHAADAPWVLVRAPGLREQLAPFGVVVRDCASVAMAGFVRIAVPDADGLTRLAGALDARKLRSGPRRLSRPNMLRGARHRATTLGMTTGRNHRVQAIVFDIGDTLVHAATPGSAVADLVATPIGDAVSFLHELSQQFRLGAVTDTSVMTEGDVRSALSECGLGDLLKVIVTSVDVGAAKPDPRGLRLAMERLGVAPEQTLFVGDADVDEGAARAAGAHFVRAGHGQSARDPVERFLRDGAEVGGTDL